MRRALIAVSVAAVVVTAVLAGTAGGAPARAPGAATYAYGAREQAPKLNLRAGQAPAGFTGGPVTASDGETVNIYVEDTLLQADPNAQQRWADALAGLLHGPEVSQVTLYLATLDRVQQICGSRSRWAATGADMIAAIGEDLFDAHGVVRRHARVRASHREQQAERSVAGGGLGHEALGFLPERLPEGRHRCSSSPATRTAATS